MTGDLINQFGNALSSPNFAARVSMIMLESAICEKISSYFHISLNFINRESNPTFHYRTFLNDFSYWDNPIQVMIRTPGIKVFLLVKKEKSSQSNLLIS